MNDNVVILRLFRQIKLKSPMLVKLKIEDIKDPVKRNHYRHMYHKAMEMLKNERGKNE